MDRSPKGREIKWIDGNGGDIYNRGKQIVDLGNQMVNSAAILKAIADGASGMKGLSVDKIKETTGDAHVELKKAGELYAPTGDVLKDYGTALSNVHSGLQGIIDQCETLWSRYETENGQYWDLKDPWGAPTFDPDPGTDTQAEQDKQDKIDDAKHDAAVALSNFVDEAEKFDTKYDTWEDAFDEAVRKIGDVTDGKIEDSMWDDLSGLAEFVLTILTIAGLVLAVLCLVIGGPILAIIAAVVAIATLLVTLYLFFQGHKDGWDVLWAVVGIIPFGKLGALKSLDTAPDFFKAIVAFDEFGKVGPYLDEAAFAFSAGFRNGPAGLKTLFGGMSAFSSMRGPMSGGAGFYARLMSVDNVFNATDGQLWLGLMGDMFFKNGSAFAIYTGETVDTAVADAGVDSWRDQLAN